MVDRSERAEINSVARKAVDICFNIHRKYGPGMFETVYEEIFFYEWARTGLPVERQKRIRVLHEGVDMGIGFIPDAILDGKVIMEFKSIEELKSVHFKQLATYLKVTGLKLGILVNFNVPLIKNGIYRVANDL